MDSDEAASSAKLLQSEPHSISRRLLESQDETGEMLNNSYSETLEDIEKGSGYDPATAQVSQPYYRLCRNSYKINFFFLQAGLAIATHT